MSCNRMVASRSASLKAPPVTAAMRRASKCAPSWHPAHSARVDSQRLTSTFQLADDQIVEDSGEHARHTPPAVAFDD